MSDRLEATLRRIDGRGYKAYKDLEGQEWEAQGVRLRMVKVQGDPFAPPSIVEARVGLRVPKDTLDAPIPVCDLLYRRLHALTPRYSSRMGEGGSGSITIPRPSPLVIARSGAMCRSQEGAMEAAIRLRAGLPSRGRRILGGRARELLLDRIPKLVAEAASMEARTVERHVYNWRVQEWIREALPRHGLVSFIGNGSILPRRCGGCWEPLEGAVPFQSPPSLEVVIELPDGSSVEGMGVRRGLTVIAGPAFHGKTTLAEAIASGVWNHVEGDGRERVVTIRNAVTLESENGRWVSCVDLSQWIQDLPGRRDTRCFTTTDASGATSLFASLQEAIEAGAEALIVDEDMTATNALHRDQWVERVTGKRTIITLADAAGRLKRAGISLVIVASGAIPLLSQADTIIVMDEYRPVDATWYREEARRVAEQAGYKPEEGTYQKPAPRTISKPVRIEKHKVRGEVLEARGLEDRVNLAALRQLEEQGQVTTAASLAVRLAGSRCGKPVDARALGEKLSRGLFTEVLGPRVGPEAAEVRGLDIAWILNRLPGLGFSSGC
ncbi:MAG: ABC-ATPase domain-containing protein [Desulfurococcales archaeon]|nr:ABC-ATPase domain-containing protein [Desulfurococcales archaeon]